MLLERRSQRAVCPELRPPFFPGLLRVLDVDGDVERLAVAGVGVEHQVLEREHVAHLQGELEAGLVLEQELGGYVAFQSMSELEDEALFGQMRVLELSKCSSTRIS